MDELIRALASMRQRGMGALDAFGWVVVTVALGSLLLSVMELFGISVISSGAAAPLFAGTVVPALIFLVFVEVMRSTSFESTTRLREKLFDGAIGKLSDMLAVHGYPRFAGKEGPDATGQPYDQVGYSQHWTTASPTDRSEYMHCWRHVKQDHDGTLWILYSPDPADSSRRNVVMICVWQYGDTAKIGVFFDLPRMERTWGKPATDKIIDITENLFVLCQKSGLERLQRGELTLIQNVVTREHLLADRFACDSIQTEFSHLSAHLIMHLYQFHRLGLIK